MMAHPRYHSRPRSHSLTKPFQHKARHSALRLATHSGGCSHSCLHCSRRLVGSGSSGQTGLSGPTPEWVQDEIWIRGLGETGMKAEKWPTSSGRFQTISQVGIPGPGVPGSRLQPHLSFLYPCQSQDTPSRSCSSSHPEPTQAQLHPTPPAVPGQKSTTTQTNINSRRPDGKQWTNSRGRVNSVCTASAHPRPPQSWKGMLGT